MIVSDNLDFSRVSDCANYLSKAAHTAYWMAGRDEVCADHHGQSILVEFHKIADLLGFRVEKIAQPAEASEAAE
jgi:hypothetical protein